MWKRPLNNIFATIYPDWIEVAMRVINGLRSWYWKEISSEMLGNKYQVLTYGRPFKSCPLVFDDQAIVDSFAEYNNKVHREYFLKYPEEVVFEPRFGWAMTRKGEIITDSLPYTYYALLPGFYDYLRGLYPPKDVIKIKKIASLRDVGDKNYYHFFNDHLVKLAFFNKYGIGDDTPLLISKTLFSKPYFTEAAERSGLDKRIWIVQDTEYVVSKESIFCGTMPITIEYYNYILEILKPPKPNPNKHRRIFINRGKGYGRCISNITEIEKLLGDFDFEAVNLDDCSLDKQMILFSEAGTVVGIHGAGLTNIIFRTGEALNVIEIFPPNNIPAMYYWMSSKFGFRYDAIVGEKKNWKRADRQKWCKIDFYLDPEKLRRKILNMT